MKILQVNVVYKKGSTGKIVEEVHKRLIRDGIESVVCYGRGQKITQDNVYKICSEFESKVCHLMSYIFGITDIGFLFSTRKLERIILREKPYVVHLHCLNGYFVSVYRLLKWLKKKHIKVVLTLHAEFMYTGGCSHALDCCKWRDGSGCDRCDRWRNEPGSILFPRTGRMYKRLEEAFSGFCDNIRVVSVSPWLEERAKASLILKDLKHSTVLNGLDTGVFKPRDAERLKCEAGLSEKRVVFHSTASFSDEKEHIKGGYYLIELAKSLNGENIQFLVAGNNKCETDLPGNITVLGNIAEQDRLAECYSMADLTVLTSFRETFSMVVAESLCCGTPVVGFKAGAPEQITIKEYSEFVDTKDIKQLRRAVLDWLSKEKDDKLPELAKEKYDSEAMYKNYTKVYSEILK